MSVPWPAVDNSWWHLEYASHSEAYKGMKGYMYVHIAYSILTWSYYIVTLYGSVLMEQCQMISTLKVRSCITWLANQGVIIGFCAWRLRAWEWSYPSKACCHNAKFLSIYDSGKNFAEVWSISNNLWCLGALSVSKSWFTTKVQIVQQLLIENVHIQLAGRIVVYISLIPRPRGGWTL